MPQTDSFPGTYYDGKLSRTKFGHKCLNWLERGGSTCSEFECGNHNHCRHFPGIEGHWCYVSFSDNWEGWENCEVPLCSEKLHEEPNLLTENKPKPSISSATSVRKTLSTTSSTTQTSTSKSRSSTMEIHTYNGQNCEDVKNSKCKAFNRFKGKHSVAECHNKCQQTTSKCYSVNM